VNATQGAGLAPARHLATPGYAPGFPDTAALVPAPPSASRPARWLAVAFVVLTLGACRRSDTVAAGSSADKRVGLSATGERRVAITITADGFVPEASHVTVGEPVTLVVTRMVEQTCAKDLVIEDYAILAPLPLGEPVQVHFTPTRPGRIRFAACAINLVAGELIAE
jgi:hypothetical protein